jgi:transposase
MKEETELKKLIKSKESYICLRRVQCVYLQKVLGWNSEQIAPLVGYCPSYVREVQSEYKKEGKPSFYLSGSGGRIRENMSIEEEAALINEFRDEAEKGGVLEISKIHEAYTEKLIEKGKEKPAKSTIYRMLDRHGWRKIMPRPKHAKNDKNKMENFKKDRVSTNNQ